jgi:hypothetical protein
MGFPAVGEQSAGQRLAEAATLSPGMDVQLGQLEVARHQLGDPVRVGTDAV